MTRALLSRLAAVALINAPVAWLMMSTNNQSIARQQAAITTGHALTPGVMHGFGYWFLALQFIGVAYVVLVEAIAFAFRGEWRRSRDA